MVALVKGAGVDIGVQALASVILSRNISATLDDSQDV